MQLKAEMTELGRVQAGNMEALAHYRPHAKNHIDSKDMLWVCGGPYFVRYPAEQVREMLMKDQKMVEQDRERIRKVMKQKVAELHKYRPSDMDSPSVRLLLRDALRAEDGLV